MATLTKVISSTLDSLGRRIIKVLRSGKDDAQTATEALPYGFDSNPIAGMRAVFTTTANKKQKAIVGYFNVNQLSETGESRMYSTDDNGELKIFIRCKKDGTILLGGDVDNAVKYTPLNSGLQDLVTQLQEELLKIQAGITAGGGTYTPGTLSLDVSGSKIDEIKTP